MAAGPTTLRRGSLPPGTVPTGDRPCRPTPTVPAEDEAGRGWLDGEPEWFDESAGESAGDGAGGDVYTASAAEEGGKDRTAAVPAPGGATSDLAAEMPVDEIAPPEAGPLRAGSVDDNADFDGFLEYLERIHSIGIALRDFDPTGRIVVTVTGTSGLPVAGAEVVVSTGGAEVARVRTTADGTARFHPAAYGAAGATSFDFTLGSQTVTAEPGGTAALAADAAGGATAPVAVDVMFLLDATGSMGDEIDQLKTSIDSVASRLSSLDSAPDIRFAMTLYRDVDDTFVTSTFDFTSDVEAFRTALSNVVADGGDDYPEALDEGLAESLKAPAWRDPSSTIQLMFLVADAPPQVGRQLQGNGYPDSIVDAVVPRHQDLPGRLVRERRPGRSRLPPARPGDRRPLRVPVVRRRRRGNRWQHRHRSHRLRRALARRPRRAPRDRGARRSHRRRDPGPAPALDDVDHHHPRRPVTPTTPPFCLLQMAQGCI